MRLHNTFLDMVLWRTGLDSGRTVAFWWPQSPPQLWDRFPVSGTLARVTPTWDQGSVASFEKPVRKAAWHHLARPEPELGFLLLQPLPWFRPLLSHSGLQPQCPELLAFSTFLLSTFQQKGLPDYRIFLLGILCGSASRVSSLNQPLIFLQISRIASERNQKPPQSQKNHKNVAHDIYYKSQMYTSQPHLT